MAVVTISRQYASGGSDIAKLLAQRLGWPVVDNEFVDRVAQEAGLPRKEVEAREERVPGLVERLARALAISSPEVFVAAGDPTEAPFAREAELVRVTETVINRTVREGNVVLVGRGAQAYLAQREDTLHVFIVGSREARVQAAMSRLEMTAKDAEEAVDRADAGRRRYVKTHYNRLWDEPANYHLVLNSDVFSYEQIADLIAAAVRMRGWFDRGTDQQTD